MKTTSVHFSEDSLPSRWSALCGKSILIGAALVALLPRLSEGALLKWEADFSKSPYEVGETVVDAATGWAAGNIASGELGDASVQALAGGPALRINSSRTGSGSVTSIYHTFAEPIAGNTIRLEFFMAFSNPGGNSTSASALVYFNRLDGMQSSPFFFGYAPSTADGYGIFYNNTGGANVTILDKNNVKEGAFYHFTVELDYLARTFDLSVSGVDASDAAFDVTYENLAFRSSADGDLKFLVLNNQRGDRILMDVESIKFEVIPEPSTAGIAVAGIGLLGFRAFAGKRKSKE